MVQFITCIFRNIIYNVAGYILKFNMRFIIASFLVIILKELLKFVVRTFIAV